MILIVDDSATNQVLLEAILQEEGFETVTAFGAREATKIIEKHKPELILLDLLMPEVSGYDFLKELRNSNEQSEIPVIVISAVNSKDNMDECQSLGANDFFAKPIDIHAFISRVRELTNSINV